MYIGITQQCHWWQQCACDIKAQIMTNYTLGTLPIMLIIIIYLGTHDVCGYMNLIYIQYCYLISDFLS